MHIRALALSGAISMMAACTGVPAAQPPLEPRVPAIEAGDSPLAFLFGEWVGTAKGVGPDRVPYEVVQTERIGPMLGGEVVVIEGRGYGAGATLDFNAFAVVSKSAYTGEWEMRSYSGGHSGTFPFEVTETGFRWSMPVGPAARMVYTATVAGGVWDQIGEYVSADGERVQVFEMNLVRTGESNWPAAGYVAPPAAH
jgi:hypothetical protein